MALSIGVKAPDFNLGAATGEQIVLADLLKGGPAVLAFFKVGCPTCQYAFPYLDRLFQFHKAGPVSFLGISQDGASDTEAFITKYGVPFAVALDDPKHYVVSNAYKLTNVPTLYLIDRQGTVQMSSVGWARSDIEDLNHRLSVLSEGRQTRPIFKPGEEIAAFKAG
jgi:peroxiredoxin